VLAFALPMSMVALVLFPRNRKVMGEFANDKLTDVAAIIGTALIVCLNALLLLKTFGVAVPGEVVG